MAASFLHGVETISTTTGGRTVTSIRSSVIGIVGTAPTGPNGLTLCFNDKDDEQFGVDTLGYTLPAALASLREMGAGLIFVVNVYTPQMLNPTNVTLADIIGGKDEHGQRHGMQLWHDAYGTYGFEPKILIAPGYSTAPTVAAALDTAATKLRAVAYTDLPLGLTPAEAIASRSGAAAGLVIYQSNSDRLRICYPHVQRFDGLTSGNVLEPLSIRLAGLRAYVDVKYGWWTSLSNKTLTGVVGLERVLTSRINDADSETNVLNSVGITTVFNAWGTGFKSWGNRTALYPSTAGMETFEQVRRTRDVIEESIEQASFIYIDADLDQAMADGLTELVNGYLRSLTNKAIMGGICWFDPNRTPVSELQNGQIRVQYKFTPKVPTERITYESEMTFEYLLTLKRTTGVAA